jgi:hypothetical protein
VSDPTNPSPSAGHPSPTREDNAILGSAPCPSQGENRPAEPSPSPQCRGDLTSPNEPTSPLKSLASGPVAVTPAEVGNSLSPNASSVHVRVSAVPKRGVVTVELRLGEGVTADGAIKDVEFLFNIEQDNYEVSPSLSGDGDRLTPLPPLQVVAAEMKQELNLTIPTDQLAVLIQHHVDAVLHTNGVNPTPAPAPPPPPLQAEAPEILPTPTDLPAQEISTTPISPAVAPAPLPVGDAQAVQQRPSQHESEVLSPRLDLASKSDDLSHVATIHGQGHGHSQPSDDSGHRHSKSPDDPSLPSAAVDPNPSKLEIPKPDSDASPEELADFTELLRELEKIDKECRAARRVFEQRIQKHKIIQVPLPFSPSPSLTL